MKKLLCMALCALLAASVIVSAQNAQQDRQRSIKKSTAAQDPFGAGSPAPDDSDPFGAGSPDPVVSDPFGGPAVDGVGADPFAPDNSAPAQPKRKANESVVAKGSPKAESRNYFVVPIREPAHARQRIEAILDQEANFDYLDQPLNEILQDIAFMHKLPIVLDKRALDDFGLDTATPINCSLKGVTLRSALRLVLREQELTYMIRDEVLLITTNEQVKMQPLVALYPLSNDLTGDDKGEWLVEVITSVVAPETWTDAGGSASVVYVPHLRMLAVRQTGDVLAEIGKLITTLEEVAKARSRRQY